MANYATSSLKLSDTYVNTLPYNTCSTAAGTAAKTVSAGTFSLETGAMVVVKFTTTNTAANPTLNVSSTGAKAIYYNGAAITAGYLKANKVYQFIYSGTQWDLVGDVDTGYSRFECASNYASLSTAGWYRVASRDIFGTTGTLEWDLSRTFTNQNSEAYQLLVSMGHSNCKFTQINSNVNSIGITKVRLVLSSSSPNTKAAYLEIYYNLSTANTVFSYIRGNSETSVGWNNVAFEAGSIPSGYTSIEFTLSSNPIKATTIEGNLNGNATTATTATSLAMSSGNEINFAGNTTATAIWFNYRDTSTGVSSGNTTPITQYRFGNTNGTTSGVTLYANNFSGNAATATTLKNLTATVTELNFVEGVTSDIQTQLDDKVSLSETLHLYCGNASSVWD